MFSLLFLSTGLVTLMVFFSALFMFIVLLPIYCLYMDSNPLNRVKGVSRHSLEGFKP